MACSPPTTTSPSCPDRIPTRSSPTWIRSSARPSLATSGPVAILAGAGSGKTRVISRRTAYAIATAVVPADQVLVVTFTEKAAGEMVGRLRDLGLPGVTARTFHAHALSQLRFFWPLRHDGEPLPELLDSKAPDREPARPPAPRPLPVHAGQGPRGRDRVGEVAPDHPAPYEAEAVGREPPIPADLFVRVYEGYERAKARANRIDFDDLLLETVALLESDEEAADDGPRPQALVQRGRVPGHEPAPAAAPGAVAGPERADLCVVGDEDQTIYTFTGASSDVPHGLRGRAGQGRASSRWCATTGPRPRCWTSRTA